MLLQVDFSPYIARNLSLKNVTTFSLLFRLPKWWLTHTELFPQIVREAGLKHVKTVYFIFHYIFIQLVRQRQV